jgi:predicted acylesterase/phospholipase RssA
MLEMEIIPKRKILIKFLACFKVLSFGVFLGLYTLLTGCSSVDLNTRQYNQKDFYFISSPNQRQLAPDTYFNHEYKYLNKRQGLSDSEARPERLQGLAFSGGGIRSAAFQLGMLSGLHSIKIDGAPLLSRIDYISSVSGGSWANGSYWGTRQTDEKFFSCLNAFANDGNTKPGCDPPSAQLRNTQTINILPLDDDGLKQRKEIWEEDIISAHLVDCNIDFAKPANFAPCLAASVNRPYPIFNSTHSSSEEEASATHYPFQSTPDYHGTVIDDAEYKGFFLRSGSPNFLWEYRKWQRWIPGGSKDLQGELLSLILSHSSGVIGRKKPFLLQYNFHAHFKDEEIKGSPIKGLRRIYNLADGGKSDNLGLLPLLERGVDTIIVSQMGKEGEDFGDIKLAAEQANQLFGCYFKSDWKRDVQPVITTPYNCPDGTAGRRQGILILVRPTIQNISQFLEYLKNQNPNLYSELLKIDSKESTEDRFPETPTFRATYPPELIRAYFLLGRYLAETLVYDAFLNSLNVE